MKDRIIDPATGRNPVLSFAGVEVPAVVHPDTGEVRVVIRPVIEDLGLSPSGQLKDLRDRRVWADLCLVPAHGKGGQFRPMMTVSLPTFVLWLNGIIRVPAARRHRLDAYKRVIECALIEWATNLVNGGAS